jgi:EmrB/QacA subfamily drug resistance transporter
MSNKTVALVASSLAVIFVTLMSSSLNVALPAISKEFGADAVLLSWIVTSFVLASAVFSLPSGRIADIVGLKKIFLLGIFLYTLTSAVAIFSTSTIMLIVCRSIQGVAGAMIAVNSFAIVTAVFPAAERGRALGINIACVYAGSSIGPFVGGILTESLGWRSIFAINIPAGIIIILLLMTRLKGEWSEAKGEKFDYPGSIIYGLGLIVLMYGFSLLPDILGGVLIFAGVAAFIGFLQWESRTASPVLNVQIFRNNRPFIFSNLAALVSYSVIFAIAFLLSLYLQDIKGLSADLAGLVLAAQPVAQTILSPIGGRLSDRIEPRIVASAGMVLLFVGLFFFSFLNQDTSLMAIIGLLILIGIGFGLFSSPNANAIMSSVVPKFFGVASAVMSTVRSVGQMFSMGITITAIAIIVGRVAIVPQNHEALLLATRVVFGIFAFLCFLGIFASLSRGKIRQDSGTPKPKDAH